MSADTSTDASGASDDATAFTWPNIQSQGVVLYSLIAGVCLYAVVACAAIVRDHRDGADSAYQKQTLIGWWRREDLHTYASSRTRQCGVQCRSAHLWLSVFGRAFGSSFSSLERATVALMSASVSAAVCAILLGDGRDPIGADLATAAVGCACGLACAAAVSCVFERSGAPGMREQFEWKFIDKRRSGLPRRACSDLHRCPPLIRLAAWGCTLALTVAALLVTLYEALRFGGSSEYTPASNAVGAPTDDVEWRWLLCCGMSLVLDTCVVRPLVLVLGVECGFCAAAAHRPIEVSDPAMPPWERPAAVGGCGGCNELVCAHAPCQVCCLCCVPPLVVAYNSGWITTLPTGIGGRGGPRPSQAAAKAAAEADGDAKGKGKGQRKAEPILSDHDAIEMVEVGDDDGAAAADPSDRRTNVEKAIDAKDEEQKKADAKRASKTAGKSAVRRESGTEMTALGRDGKPVPLKRKKSVSFAAPAVAGQGAVDDRGSDDGNSDDDDDDDDDVAAPNRKAKAKAKGTAKAKGKGKGDNTLAGMLNGAGGNSDAMAMALFLGGGAALTDSATATAKAKKKAVKGKRLEADGMPADDSGDSNSSADEAAADPLGVAARRKAKAQAELERKYAAAPTADEASAQVRAAAAAAEAKAKAKAKADFIANATAHANARADDSDVRGVRGVSGRSGGSGVSGATSNARVDVSALDGMFTADAVMDPEVAAARAELETLKREKAERKAQRAQRRESKARAAEAAAAAAAAQAAAPKPSLPAGAEPLFDAPPAQAKPHAKRKSGSKASAARAAAAAVTPDAPLLFAPTDPRALMAAERDANRREAEAEAAAAAERAAAQLRAERERAREQQLKEQAAADAAARQQHVAVDIAPDPTPAPAKSKRPDDQQHDGGRRPSRFHHRRNDAAATPESGLRRIDAAAATAPTADAHPHPDADADADLNGAASPAPATAAAATARPDASQDDLDALADAGAPEMPGSPPRPGAATAAADATADGVTAFGNGKAIEPPTAPDAAASGWRMCGGSGTAAAPPTDPAKVAAEKTGCVIA